MIPTSAPIYNGKDTIVQAYRSTNPNAYMLQTIEIGTIQQRDVIHLIQNVFQQNSECPRQQQVRQDITLCREYAEEQTSDQGQLAKYVYFCTAMPHIWVRFGKETGVYYLSTVKAPIVVYMAPNKVSCYVWFNYHKDRIVLVKHTLPQRPHPLKVLCHTISKESGGSMKMTDTRTAFELSNNRPMTTSKSGSFLQLSYNTMSSRFDLPRHGATSYADFVVILTSGPEYQLNGVYFNESSQGKPSSCQVATLLHEA